MDRRGFLIRSGALLATSALGGVPSEAAADASGLKFGPAAPFSYRQLINEARNLASAPYRPASIPEPDVLQKLDYAAWGAIHYRTRDALFADGPGQFPVTFFHLGRDFQRPVRMFVVDSPRSARPTAREIIYEKSYFEMPPDNPAQQLKAGVGFAGFRFQESRLGDQNTLNWRKNDWAAFLGASYFRAIGALHQYGMSARGIAVNTAVDGLAEEFPDFTKFFLQPQPRDNNTVIVHALLDGPSVTGAYRFTMERTQAVLMDVEARLFIRKDIERFGIAPLTSMYWFSDTAKPTAIDWRPQVHDSDGLFMWNGDGERIWRPLNNPPHLQVAAFMDKKPRGFGLMQSDRNFNDYLSGVFYNRRPSVWVRPLQNWGEGSIQLIEIPTNDEIYDNIVAMWVPKAKARAGDQYHFRYRLYWVADAPFPGSLARCVATRLGRGGQPGLPRPPDVRKFCVEFTGGPLKTLSYGVIPEAIVTASRGELSRIYTQPVPDGVSGHWRAFFDLKAEGKEPVELRLYLRNKGKTLTNTWLYRYLPFESHEWPSE